MPKKTSKSTKKAKANREIADKHEIAVKTVERKVDVIERVWLDKIRTLDIEE